MQIECIGFICRACKNDSITYKIHILFFSGVIVVDIDVINVKKVKKKNAEKTYNDYSDFEDQATVYLYTIAGNVCAKPNE